MNEDLIIEYGNEDLKQLLLETIKEEYIQLLKEKKLHQILQK